MNFVNGSKELILLVGHTVFKLLLSHMQNILSS